MTDQTSVLPPEPAPPVTRRTRGVVAIVASVAVVVLVAAGGFAAWRALSGAGPRPAEVLPDSVFALVTIDLDPAGGQKLEAIRTLREFPAFRDRVGLTPESDPVRWIFEKAQDGGTCTELDYERDVKSWIGQRAGVGGAMLEGQAVPVATLQVSDPDNARAGFRRLAECAGLAEDGDFGWTLAGEYLVFSDSTVHAETLAARGQERPLSENADYQRWTEEAGGPGIMNVYLGRESPDALAEQLGDSGERGDSGALADGLAAYRDFRGAAAVLRFEDGGIELSMAGSGGKATRGSKPVADHVAALPADTALLLALAVPPGALEALSDSGGGSQLLGGLLGIDVPQDLQTLLGSSFSLSLGGTPPADLGSVSGPADLSFGALVRGDVEEIEAVIAKLERSTGTSLTDLGATLRSGDGTVALASTPEYADQLLADGSLGRDDGFTEAVPEADRAQGLLYADLDGDWGRAVVEALRTDGGKDAAELADNLAVVRSVAASGWTQGEVSHGLLRLDLSQ